MAPGRALPPRRLYRHKPGAVTRAGRGLLQPSRHLRAVHQRGKGRDQVDPAVMPHLRRQRRPPSTSCARLQSGQLHADAGDTRSDQGLVADQLEGKADQDWREGRQPWALRGLPTRRGRGVAADVRGYPVADRPVADTTRPGMTGRRSQMRQSTTAEARLDGGKQRVPAPRAHAARHFCCQRAGCYRISLRRRRDDGKITPTEPGIWGMSVEPERRKSRNSTFLYLHVSQRLSRIRNSRRPFSVVVPSITRRIEAKALMACSALLLFHGTSSKSRNVNIVLRFFCKRSMIFLAASPAPNPPL